MAQASDPVRFLDALRVEHGPRSELGAYFLRAATDLKARGIDLYLSRDCARLDRLGPDYDAHRPERFPGLDAALAGFGPTHWFVLEGRFDTDRPAFIAACRLIETATSFADELTSFRLFYASPERQRRADDAVDISAPGPASLSGRLALQGGFWVNPAWRGQGLARVFPTICRRFALTLWDIDHALGFYHADDGARGLAQVYGEPAPEAFVHFHGRWEDRSWFSHQSRAAIEAALSRDDAASRETTLTNDRLDTYLSPDAVRHGKTSRS